MGGFQKMAKENAFFAFQNECGVCAEYPHARGRRGLILNGMSDSLFDVCQIVETSKELWDTLEAKYMAENALDFKHTLKHLKEDLTLIELGSHLHIEESLRVQNNDKPKGNNDAGPSVFNMVEHNNSFRYNDNKGGNVGNKANGSGTKGSGDGSSNPLKETVHVCKDRCWFKTYELLNDGSILHMGNESTSLIHGRGYVDLRGIECIFVGYAEHSKPLKFYVIEPNDSVAINSIIESKDAIFDEHRFSSVPRLSQRSLKDRTEYFGGLLVSERVTEEVVQQPESELRKSKMHMTLKDFRPEFQLYLIEGTMDEISDQHSYFFNVEDDPKTFDEAMNSQDVAFWKEVINDEMDSIMGNNTWVLIDLPLAKLMDLVDLTKEFLSSRFYMKDMREADVILGIRIKHESNGIVISQSHYIEKVLKKFNYSDCTPVSIPLDTCEKLMPNKGPTVSQLEYTSNPGTQHWQAIQRVLKYLKKTIDYRLVYSGY
nr:zinc finger, CCHC-type [Tanacetum cinerariifolium]